MNYIEGEAKEVLQLAQSKCIDASLNQIIYGAIKGSLMEMKFRNILQMVLMDGKDKTEWIEENAKLYSSYYIMCNTPKDLIELFN